jgi:protocatechuate 3,4-dioxygenase beta subunit
VTDEKGQFIFRSLAPQPYHMTVTLMGFQTVVRDVTVEAGVPMTEHTH